MFKTTTNITFTFKTVKHYVYKFRTIHYANLLNIFLFE